MASQKWLERVIRAIQQNFDTLQGDNQENVRQLNKLAADMDLVMNHLGVQVEAGDVVAIGTGGGSTTDHDELEGVSANDHHNQVHAIKGTDHTGQPPYPVIFPGEGDEGPFGAPGRIGQDGATGATGAQGDPGPAGADGTIGRDGTPGLPGEDADGFFLPGPPGNTGATGAQGAQGDPGSAGSIGPAGTAVPWPGAEGEDGFLLPPLKPKTGDSVDVQVFTSAGAGTWTKPAGALWVEVIGIGGGGGGGAGRRGAAGTHRYGGGGGGGGALVTARIPASVLGATEGYQVGAGGAGASGQTVDDTAGAGGTNGNDTFFGDSNAGHTTGKFLVAPRGLGGGGGTAGAGAGGNGGGDAGAPHGQSILYGAAGGDGSNVAGSNGGTIPAVPSLTNYLRGGAPGGGGGGGINDANVADRSGGDGGDWWVTAGGAGAVAGASVAVAGTAAEASTAQAGGGGGGGASQAGERNAAAGGVYGAGGGGGAASLNGATSGDGGAGADGILIVTTYLEGAVGPAGAAGAAGSNTVAVEEANVVVDAAVSTLDFQAGFDVTADGADEVNIALDLSEVSSQHDSLDHSTALGTAVLNDLSDVSGAAVTGDILAYDGSGWVPDDGSDGVADGAFRASIKLGTRIWHYTECFLLGTVDGDTDGWLGRSVGTGALVTHVEGEANHPGIAELQTGTTATGHSRVCISATAARTAGLLLGSGATRFITWLRIPTDLSSGTQTFIVRAGLGDNLGSVAFTNGVWFSYTDAVNGGRWLLNAIDGSGSETADSGVTAVAAGTWYKLEIRVNAAGSSAEFFVDDVSVGTLSTRIPATAGESVGPIVNIYKTVGTTERLLHVDAVVLDSVLSR